MGPAPDVSSSHYDDDYSDDYEPHDQEVEEGGGGEEVEEFGEAEEPESENDGTDQEEDEGEAKHTEDKDAIHTPSPTLSLVLIWFRRMANAVLRPLGFGLCKQS